MPNFDNIAKLYPGAGTLVKGIQLIELIAQSAEPCNSTFLLKQTRLPKATLYRLLGALVEFGYIKHDLQSKTYSLGKRFIELGRSSLSAFDLRSAAEHELQRLAGDLGQTVSLVVLEGDHIIYVDVRRPANPLAVGIDVGRTLPVADSTSGRAILAAMPPHEMNNFLNAYSTEERHRILSEIAISRARGYSIAESRSIPGLTVVAVEVHGPPGMGRGAIAVTAHESALSHEQRHIVGRDLMEAARRVMGNIGTASVSISSNPRRHLHVEEALTCIHPAGAIVGEGPVWDSRTHLLRWVDIAAPATRIYDPSGTQTVMKPASRLVSAVLPAADGSIVAVTQNGLEMLDPQTGALEPIYDPEAHLPANRFNDAKTDRAGRIWAGTMSLDASMPSGSLYCFDTTTRARAVDGGFQVSNGLGWSADDKTFYFTDSGLGIVFAYDFDIEKGLLSNRRIFLQFQPSEGKPDGLAVDAEGTVWIALWDGWRVAGYDPKGRLVREIDMPVPRPTSCCFGGEDMKTLFITTASIRLPASVLEEAPLSGGLFAVSMDVAGQPTVEVAL
ncbi:SMP-30/gluconolactonase/LRE family protein [Rhizobium sp. SSA_523]|uniref:SMP-30/gluconolactonase/LRE family protein n=1 Tax=Rhizobium sp. SSA_523 TaxID=2952477 RepID=UPI002090AF60|nr:SMP-30/gluconolactonase/LRE family protein [Rhizobium sp. SSA_523]MCO5732193.1 SMP-30/gluconolactonase/LRE family protein [Rhizobium sp. SSA_523]WKC21392.1 SMP-30/gluconolactonase/LRE family protein [Rhizobium sp. SSA_523]